ncbi:polysaccharide synthesis protein GtrA [Skermanella stibiiresistens SB22]|uniref:Polysaccharide synthesis protein GtrA n=1 Tax=Skermanella stibiiresistens SB22 TaxID=1385369 RepID=W9GYL5_9PROT|nr:GtrA family protein [Skermanella stibiiresistens]EWY38914.1 polysaccharide synthesis protein GtrA [Skermanella stibiiresistens SB22]
MRRLGTFAVIGVSNTLIDIGIYALLSGGLGIHPVVANTVSYSTGTLSSYLMNRRWTFRDRGSSNPARQFVAFCATNLITLATCNAVMASTLDLAPEAAIKVLVVAIGFMMNYTMSNLLVFRRR